MTQHNTSSRRSFLKGSALLAAPIAAASMTAVALADDGLKNRVARLEDEAAIRALHQSWLREINAGSRELVLDGTVRRITAAHDAAADRIEVAPHGASAEGHFDQLVELEAPLIPDSTLAQMAHAQGNGTVRRSERRMLRIAFTKAGGVWQIGKVSSSRI